MDQGCAVLSVFIREPVPGQTKTSCRPDAAAAKPWCGIISTIGWRKARPRPQAADFIIDWPRTASQRQEKEVWRRRRRAAAPARQAGRLLREPPKAPIFLVEGDAGGSAPSRRAIETPRRSCPCAARSSPSPAPRRQDAAEPGIVGRCRRWAAAPAKFGRGLRYERVIIMTDADVTAPISRRCC